MKFLGALKCFLGIEVARSKQGMFLCQHKYVFNILSDDGFLGANHLGFPMDRNHKLGKAKGPFLPQPDAFHRSMGLLIYLTCTRPDLAFSVQVLSQFMHQPRQDHWGAAFRVLRYIKHTLGQGLFLHSDSDLQLCAYYDSDWANCPITC